jgi:beta-lactamase class A
VSRRFGLLALLVLAACSAEPDAEPRKEFEATVAISQRPSADASALDSVLAAIEAESGGRMGVVAVHLPSGRRVARKGGDRYPMASTFKVAVAMAVLARVDSGRVRLADSLDIHPRDFRLAPMLISDSVGPDGGRASVAQLVRLMMVAGDNAATDRLLRMLGGPATVMAHLRDRGIDGISVDRSEGEVHWQYNGVRDVPPEAEWTLERFERLTSAVPPARRDSAHAAFFADSRDTGTPEAFVALLGQLARGEGISAESRRFLLDAMQASSTGLRRIRAGVPAGTTVAEKTGTIGPCANDVGLITLPDGSQVAIAVFVRESARGREAAEAAIARTAGAVYAHFAGTASAAGA